VIGAVARLSLVELLLGPVHEDDQRIIGYRHVLVMVAGTIQWETFM